MTGAWWRLALVAADWFVAVAWCFRVYGAARHMPNMPDLTMPVWNRAPMRMPSLTVIVPARNEESNIAATLGTLVAQDYLWLQVVAVNDRSSDRTGVVMDDFAARFPQRVRVLHINELPSGWLGKTHAVHTAVQESSSDYLLFTDADVLFEPTVLRRSLAYAEQEKAAHLVVGPTPILRSPGEGAVLGFFQMLGLWATRPWRVADPSAKRDTIGVGAFNLVRREALERIGGFEPQKLAVLEDVMLGIRFKAAGLPQRLAFAPHMIQVHWAPGIRGIVRVTTKNLFATVNFRPELMLGACLALLVLFLLPLPGLLWWPTMVPSFIVLCCLGVAFREMSRMSSVKLRYALFYPVGAVAILWAMLRSMATTLAQRGIVWRGTHYPLRELRKNNSPFQWERAVRNQVR